MNKKVLLVYTPGLYRDYTNENQYLEFPVGILSIASLLKEHGFQVEIIDGNIDGGYTEKIRKNLGNALFVGFSVMTTQVKKALEASRMIKKINKNIPVVWGGFIHPLFLPKRAKTLMLTL